MTLLLLQMVTVDVEGIRTRHALLSDWVESIEHRDWGRLFEAYDRLGSDARGGCVCVLASFERLLPMNLPPEALAYYRTRHDDDAWSMFTRAVGRDSPGALAELIDRHFFSSLTDEATMRLSSWYIESGRAAEAVPTLRRLLRDYPDPDVPRSLVAARLVHALELAGDRHALRRLADWIAEREWTDEIRVGHERVVLADYARAAADRCRPGAAKAETIVTKVYDVRDLLFAFHGEAAITPEAIEASVRACGCEGCWLLPEAAVAFVNNMLVVTQTEATQREVADLLKSRRRHR